LLQRRARCAAAALGALALLLAGAPVLPPEGAPVARAADPAVSDPTVSDTPAAGFRRAEGTRAWRFPRDHGQHPDYRLEWWYWTGIVRTAQGRTFGYQVTFFREGVRPPSAPPRRSEWAVRSLYLAHAAVSDVQQRRFLHDSRAERDSLGLSGAAPDALHVWLRDWRAEPLADDPDGVRLQVAAQGFALELVLRSAVGAAVRHGPVLNGTGGLDRKGADPGQASWYYSLPRLATQGTLRADGESWPVSGTSWMDHEFSTGALAPGLAGWDWLALRLDDGSDLMLYRLRRQDGSADAFSGGSYVAPDGTRSALALGGTDAARMEPGRTWRSPATGGRYPLEWRVALPAQGLTLQVTPAFDAQEQSAQAGTPFAYWEGVVWAEGTRNGRPVRGEGYLELTGYAGELGGALR
jgi:predicted secreted hydrolase